MSLRNSRPAGLLVMAVLLVAGLSQADEATVPRRKMLRAEVARLRGEVARLSTAVEFLQRGSDQSAPGGVIYPGHSLCEDPCATDSDGDGIGDCTDSCPCDPDTADSDGDGWADCADPCPDDLQNACLDPCNNDSDGDGAGDCIDPCPWDPAAAVDSDGDGTADCQDPCPNDIANACTDWCQTDQDGDGIPDCKDDCPWAVPVPGETYPDHCWPVPVAAP
ncbi:MAG TPA: thrombospondin type 3 repeat-containing protein [Candidatus Limnocylindrales bacterium]|nr:thrombospondin type 3 repeat-containing protein [Candidatus Limnocylindrales bacterium]